MCIPCTHNKNLHNFSVILFIFLGLQCNFTVSGATDAVDENLDDLKGQLEKPMVVEFNNRSFTLEDVVVNGVGGKVVEQQGEPAVWYNMNENDLLNMCIRLTLVAFSTCVC